MEGQTAERAVVYTKLTEQQSPQPPCPCPLLTIGELHTHTDQSHSMLVQ